MTRGHIKAIPDPDRSPRGPDRARQRPSTPVAARQSRERGRSAPLPPVKAEAGKPLYTSVKEAIRRAIEEGVYEAGQRIPSTQQLSEQLNVSLVTAHRALQELVAGGVLQRTQGRGTFVSRIEGEGSGIRARCRVGVVLHRDSSIADYYHGRIFEGVRQASHDKHIDIVLLRFGEDLRRECDGLLCVNPLPDEVETIAARVIQDTPVVVVGATVDVGRGSRGVCCIDSDNIHLARRVVERMVVGGHRRIGFVGGSERVSNSRDRWRGFREACEVASIELRDEYITRLAGWRATDRERARLAALLKSPERPTAIFAAGYHIALDVYAAASDAMVRLGKDVVLIGVDDPPSAAHLSPALATMRQPLRQMGELALSSLQKLIHGQPAASEKLCAELLLRESAGEAVA